MLQLFQSSTLGTVYINNNNIFPQNAHSIVNTARLE